MTQRGRHNTVQARSARRAFTLIEILVSLFVVFLLMAILIVSIRGATRSARSTADRAMVSSLKMAVAQFKSDNGFLPPLVDYDRDDCNGELTNGSGDPVTLETINGQDRYVINTLSGADLRDPDRCRYSAYSLGYYLVGVLPARMDGVEGPGYLTPTRDGGFDLDGQKVEAMVDLGRSATTYIEDAEAGRIELRDRNGTAIRYYSWLPNTTINGLEDLNVPRIFGDPAIDASTPEGLAQIPRDNTQFRDATYAIVAAGPNGVFGDLDTESRDDIIDGLGSDGDDYVIEAEGREDNIVEVGK